MREIKFRYWNKELKRFFYLFLQPYGEGCLINDDEGHIVSCSYDLSKYEAQEFTGFKDKNGNGIFEGDILRITDFPYKENTLDKDYEKPFYKNEKVIFSNGKFSMNGWLDFDSECIYEIIGNIYEHSELLAKNN